MVNFLLRSGADFKVRNQDGNHALFSSKQHFIDLRNNLQQTYVVVIFLFWKKFIISFFFFFNILFFSSQFLGNVLRIGRLLNSVNNIHGPRRFVVLKLILVVKERKKKTKTKTKQTKTKTKTITAIIGFFLFTIKSRGVHFIFSQQTYDGTK